ncbi:MAG: mechanosensitive ion channel family protein [Actinomycetota bacterium]
MHLFRQSDETLIDDSLTSTDWITAGVIVVGALALAITLARVLRRLIEHGIGPGFAAIVAARLAAYVVFLVGVSYALTTLGVRVGPLLGALGLGGLVLALALQGPVESLVASVILQARRPYTVGDTVEIDGERGIVADIDSRTTVLEALDGRHVRVPNRTVISTTIVNLTRNPQRRSRLVVGLAYETDLPAAVAVLRDAVRGVVDVAAEPPPQVLVDRFGESTIDVVILYWHASDVAAELTARSDLAIAVHQALDAADITIAFPQVVVWTGEPDDERRSATDPDGGPH